MNTSNGAAEALTLLTDLIAAEMKQGGEAILDKIEKRWKEISGQ